MKTRIALAFCAASLIAVSTQSLYSSPVHAATTTTTQPTKLPPIAGPHTRVMDAATLAILAPPSKSDLRSAKLALKFKGTTTYLQNLKQNDIMVAGVSKQTPEGMLRKVVEIFRAANGVTVLTAPAALSDAIAQGSYDVTANLTPNKVASFSAMRAGVTAAPQATAATPCFNLVNVSLYSDNSGNSVVANGRLCLSATVHFSGFLSLSGAGASYSASASDSAHLHLTAKGNVTVNKSINLLQLDLTPISFAIGPVPVVIVPQITFSIGVNGKISATVSTGATQSASFNAGVNCSVQWGHNPGCASSGPGLNNTFTADPITVSGVKATVTGYAGMNFAALLYGVIGGNVGLQPYVEADYSQAANPQWEVFAGLKVLIGFDLELWGFQLNPTFTLANLRKEIAHAPLQ